MNLIIPENQGPVAALVVARADILSAFDEYAARTSWSRVVLVCTLAMAPSFSVMVLIELMPLAPVEAGRAANWVLLIRCFISSVIMSVGVFTQFNAIVSLGRLSEMSIAIISIGAASGYVLWTVLLAKYWGFPVPFTVISGVPGWMSCAASCIGVTIDWRKVRESKTMQEQLITVILVSNIQFLMLTIYPAYNAGFLALSGWKQLAFVFVLPPIKFSLKWLQKRAARDSEIGMILSTSVDIFQALYSFKCMQSAGSIQSGITLIAIDLVINIHHFHDLYHKVHVLEEHIGQQFDSRDVVSSFIRLSRGSIEPHKFGRNVIFPHPINGNDLPHAKVVCEKIDALFLKCQEVLLVEFIETVVPVYYILYIAILFHLPNAKYYPEMQLLTSYKLEKLVENIAVYAGLESLSLICIHVLLKRRFNLSAMHLLAFTIETQPTVWQGIFMAWVMINLQFTLVHYGACLFLIVMLV